ncbi:hypothetical protein Sjap_002609 [Stephania japonica]|uniref:Uncharacterized protein n=1 Tax=Stephania japonica TaxID=461633 RepID=A0AAP0KPI0_9MAGN
MQLRVEFGFGEERELEYSYSNEEEFVSEEEIDGVLFLYGDARRIDPIFFEEDFENFDEEPKFDSDGYDFVEDKLIFGEDSLVIEVVSLFEVPQELEEVVRDVDVNNDSLGLIAKAKVLKFATNVGICVDGYLHDFSSQNNVLFYLFKHVETSCDDFIVKNEKTRKVQHPQDKPLDTQCGADHKIRSRRSDTYRHTTGDTEAPKTVQKSLEIRAKQQIG